MPFKPRDPRLRSVAIGCLLVGLACLYLARHASCQELAPRSSKAFTVTAVTFAALGAVDAHQSLPCLHSATCREGNPLYAHLSPAGFTAVKSATIGGGVVYAWTLRKRHPKLAWSLLGSLTALQGAVVLSNAHQLGKRS